MGFMQVGEQTDPVPNGVCKQLFRGPKSLPERQKKEPDRRLARWRWWLRSCVQPVGVSGTSVLWETGVFGEFWLGEDPKTRLLGIKSLEQPGLNRQGPFPSQERR